MNCKNRNQFSILASLLASLLFAAGQIALGQTPAQTVTYAFGEVITIDASQKQIVIKSKDGNITASFDDKTQFKRVPPGVETLDKAESITLADVSVGDTLMARGRFSEDRKTVLARQMIVMNKKAIEQKQEHDREQWRKRSIVGKVKAINAQTKEITLTVRAPEGERPVSLDASNKVIFRRYAPDSIKFQDALPSSFEELKVGDQLRTLGQRSQDGARFTAEEIVSGAFRIVGGAIVSANPATGEVTINDIPTKKPVTVIINASSILRRVPDDIVASLAKRNAQKSGQTTPTSAGDNTAAGARPQSNSTDLLEIFDRLPPVTINDLKPGRMLLISSTAGSDPSRVTAIIVAAGLDPLFIKPQTAAARPGALGAVGLPTGILDGYIGSP